MNSIEFANLKFKGLRKNFLLKEESDFKIIITCNAEIIVLANENRRFGEIINREIATIDGQIPYWFIKKKYPDIDIEKISGSDFIWDICNYSVKNNKKVFLLGGARLENQKSVERLKLLYGGLNITGFSPDRTPYPFEKGFNGAILDKIRGHAPDFLLVGFGPPKQEFWIDDNKEILKKIGVKWAIGVGGTFKLVAEVEKRAPIFIQNFGLEGAWRILHSPRKSDRLKRFIRIFKFFNYL